MPRQIYEATLIPTLLRFGEVLELRLMMCYSGDNRGFAYVIFKDQDDTLKIIKNINKQFQYSGMRMYASLSRNWRKLIIKNILKNINNLFILQIVIQFSQPKRVFFEFHEDIKCVVLEFITHREAALFRRVLISEISQFGPNTKVCWYKT